MEKFIKSVGKSNKRQSFSTKIIGITSSANYFTIQTLPFF